MMTKLLRTILVGSLLSVFVFQGGVAWSQDAGGGDAGAAAESDADDANKLLKWTTLEQAFLRARRNRQVLSQYVDRLTQQLKDTEEEEGKSDLRQKLGDARKRLHKLNTAMDVIFSVPSQRAYEYNPVQSAIFVRIGTVREVFERAVRTREALKQYIKQQNSQLEEAADEQAKAEVEEKLRAATRQYQTVAAALQIIFGVTPQRNYTYNPDNATLYLNVTEEELESLKKQLSEVEKQQGQAGEGAAGN